MLVNISKITTIKANEIGCVLTLAACRLDKLEGGIDGTGTRNVYLNAKYAGDCQISTRLSLESIAHLIDESY